MRERLIDARPCALFARVALCIVLAVGMLVPVPSAYANELQSQQYNPVSLDSALTADGSADGAAIQDAAKEQGDPTQGASPDSGRTDGTEGVAAEEGPVEEVRLPAIAGSEAAASEDPNDPHDKGQALAAEATDTGKTVEDVVARMTLDEKISQMIIVAFRTYDGTNVQQLSDFPKLAKALQKHQYGGVILYGQNIASTAQTAQLVYDLQANNAAANTSKHIPYFMTVDEEGGLVIRFLTGTRMTGSMALGATGANVQANARLTGQVLGEECAALGFNVDFAPSVDVNSNPLNPVIGTRSFSDDPSTVASLGIAFGEGLAQSNVIATYKHFPGHGDTGTDTHVDVAAVNKTIEQLRACELVPFAQAISNGADMIMTAHITLPAYDDLQALPGGNSGYYPATMSHKVITDLLRGELGYNGVVVTDALEMGAIGAALVPGEAGSVENRANIAEKCIDAGVDVLLLPMDMTKQEVLSSYDAYIAAIAAKVGTGEGKTISEDRINQSVTRILKLKQKYGIFDPAIDDPSFALDIEQATATVGSEEHHAIEKGIAREAITLLKNDDYTLPLSGHENNVVIVSRMSTENQLIAAALKELQTEGLIAEDALVRNLATGETSGSEDAELTITLDYYLNTSVVPTALRYTDDLKAAVAEADVVVGLTENGGIAALQPTSVQYRGEFRLLTDTHAAGGKFVMLSNNLPYDVARYQDSDAILLSYMASGYAYDPTQRELGNIGAYNANLIAAIQALFDEVPPQGTLPVVIPQVKEAEDGTVSYDMSAVLYDRGFGMHYAYAFLEGAGGTHKLGSTDALLFKNNARYDKLQSVLIDGKEIEVEDDALEAGSTYVRLSPDTLNSLSAGEHTLTTTYAYGVPAGATEVSTTFAITSDPSPDPEPKPEPEPEPKATPKDNDKTPATKTTAFSAASRATTPKTADPTTQAGFIAAACAAILLATGALRRQR